ncbi:hypothetical protein OXX69_004398 [Metschnikowia pulcherrima]
MEHALRISYVNLGPLPVTINGGKIAKIMDARMLGEQSEASSTIPPNLSGLFFSEPEVPAANAYVKKTLLQSPIIHQIVPQFMVNTSKPRQGLSSTYVSEEKAQTWVPPPQDSYFGDDMSEDEALMDLGNHTSLELSQDSLDIAIKEDKYAEIELVVKHTSLLVDGVEYPLTSGVTVAAVVPRTNSLGTGEDSLLVALSSGFQLLIRVWRVPRTFSDASFASHAEIEPDTDAFYVYKPFVVQWWKLGGDDHHEGACSALSVHPAGLAVVSAAPDKVFRIYTCENTESGLQLSSHFNVPVKGIILHSCFAHPFTQPGAETQIVFMALVFTDHNRLEISLYSWYASEPILGNMEKVTLPLKNTFQFPVMVVPLAKNSSFLFVCPDEFVIVTVNNIWSADYSFSKFAYDGTFPTSYHVSQIQSQSESDSATDEVFLASDSGVIFSIIVSDNKSLTCRPILRVGDPISTFTLTHSSSGEGFILAYASDTAGAKVLYIPALMAPETVTKWDKLPYTSATLLNDYKNWSPVVDVSVFDASQNRACAAESAQELWAISGVGKRTKLTQLRSGYAVKRESRVFDEFRKADSVAFLAHEDKHYILCSMPFETRLLQYVPEIDENELDEDSDEIIDPLKEIEDSGLVFDAPTLCCSLLPDSNTLFQFSRNSVTATNLEQSKTSFLTDSEILFAEIVGEIAVLAVSKNGHVTLEIIKLAKVSDFANVDDLISSNSHFRILASIQTDDDISMMKSFHVKDTIMIVCGTFSGFLELLKVDPLSGDHSRVFRISLNDDKSAPYMGRIPHDCVFSETTSKLFLGTKTGEYAQIDLDQSFSPKISPFLSLGITPVSLVLSKRDPHFLFVCVKNIWLFNFYASPSPMRVSFDEKLDKMVLSLVELPTQEPQHLRFAFLREDGLAIGSIFCHERPLVRQLGIGEPAKRLLYLDTANVFVLMCKSKGQSTRLKFADKKSFRMLPTMEIDSKSGKPRANWIFEASETATCAMVWHINRHERVSKKVIVGTQLDDNSGNLKILDISKVAVEGSRTPAIKVVELRSIARDQPVTSIQQIGSTIFFSSGASVYKTSYSLENKKFRPVSQYASLSSTVTSLGVAGDDTLLVNTKFDSVLALKYTENEDDTDENTDPCAKEPAVRFKDPIPRCLVNVTSVGDKLAGGDKLFSTLRVFDPKLTHPDHCYSVTMSMIPRVYTTSFNAFWVKNRAQEQLSCVAVNGQVITLCPVYDKGEEISTLNANLARNHHLTESTALSTVMDKLDRPFLEKVTGKGFQSVHKPFFDYQANREKFIDCDVEELSRASQSSILL